MDYYLIRDEKVKEQVAGGAAAAAAALQFQQNPAVPRAPKCILPTQVANPWRVMCAKGMGYRSSQQHVCLY